MMQRAAHLRKVRGHLELNQGHGSKEFMNLLNFFELAQRGHKSLETKLSFLIFQKGQTVLFDLAKGREAWQKYSFDKKR
jgi:hypothetical protein